MVSSVILAVSSHYMLCLKLLQQTLTYKLFVRFVLLRLHRHIQLPNILLDDANKRVKNQFLHDLRILQIRCLIKLVWYRVG